MTNVVLSSSKACAMIMKQAVRNVHMQFTIRFGSFLHPYAMKMGPDCTFQDVTGLDGQLNRLSPFYTSVPQSLTLSFSGNNVTPENMTIQDNFLYSMRMPRYKTKVQMLCAKPIL